MTQTIIALAAALGFLFGSAQAAAVSHPPVGIVQPADASLPGPL